MINNINQIGHQQEWGAGSQGKPQVWTDVGGTDGNGIDHHWSSQLSMEASGRGEMRVTV